MGGSAVGGSAFNGMAHAATDGAGARFCNRGVATGGAEASASSAPRHSQAPAAPAPAPAQDAALTAGQHRQFAYPGSGGATFVRVTHQPNSTAARRCSLQDKVLRVEADALGAHASSSAAAGAGAGAPAPARPPALAAEGGERWPAPAAQPAPLAAADGGVDGISVHSMSAPHVRSAGPAGSASAVAAVAAAAAAAFPDADVALSAPRTGAMAGGMWASSMHAMSGGASEAAGARSAGAAVPPHFALAQADPQPLPAAPAPPAPLSTHESLTDGQCGAAGEGIAVTELKALRNRVNRADGGIGRKLTLDVLKTQFGKGLKEAAESLGMCATTLKRACRRLGVKRWPRTPEAALQVLPLCLCATPCTPPLRCALRKQPAPAPVACSVARLAVPDPRVLFRALSSDRLRCAQVLTEAEEAQREMAARKSHSSPFGAPWESWPGMQGPGGSLDTNGMPVGGPGGLRMAGGMTDELMTGQKSGGFDEFDDFLDMLEVGE